MDIVPDSEPLDSDQRHAQLMNNRLSSVPSAIKRNNNVNGETRQDVVMGKVESECTPPSEDDEDVPLAVMSRKQSKAKAGPKAVNKRKGKAPQKTIHTVASTKQNVKVRQ